MSIRTLQGIAASALLVSGLSGAAETPYTKPDDSWISISGTVVAPAADAFTLDYGEGVITVEMDDWDHYGDAHGLMDGDKVTVRGRIDDDLYELRTIEASSVYVENLNTYFYASSADEEGDAWTWYGIEPIEASKTTVQGTVTSVDADDREFTLGAGDYAISVETGSMVYNPVDDVGFQQVDVGDRVSVTGQLDYEFLDGHTLHADSVVTLADNTPIVD